jgi:hypothetical protein
MKRILFALAIVVSAAANTQAQEPVVEMTQAQVEQFLRTTGAGNIKIVGTSTPAQQQVIAPATQKMSAARPVDARRAAFEYRLSRYSASAEEKAAIVEDLLARYPNAFDANGVPGSAHEINAMNSEITQMMNAQELEQFNQRTAPTTQSAALPNGATGTADCTNWNRNGHWIDAREEPWIEAQRRRVCGMARIGFLKINAIGDTDFAKYLIVKRKAGDRWVVVGSGGKAFRTFHKPMELPVGDHTLRFELRRGGETVILDEDFSIESKFDLQNPLQYPISEEMIYSFSKTTTITRPQ